MERAKLLNDLKSVASRRAVEDNEDQVLQTRMRDCVQEMSEAASDSELLKEMTKVLACYQSKYIKYMFIDQCDNVIKLYRYVSFHSFIGCTEIQAKTTY